MTDPLLTRHRTLQLVDPLPKNPYRTGSSEWWLFRLNAQLDGREASLAVLDDYYRGRQDTFRLASSAAIDSGIAQLFRGINANLSKLIVDATAQRLEVFGFRTGSDSLDEELWRIWQANDMDAESGVAHKDALAMRSCPVLVEPGPDGEPRITPQNPRTVYVETAPGDRRIIRAALKRWWGDDGRRLHTLYLPDRIEFWQDTRPSAFGSAIREALGMSVPDYEPRSLEEQTSVPNPLGEVPLAIIPNMGRSDGTYEAEHEAVLPLLDLYNKTLLDMATTSEFSAFPQRYGIGVEIDDAESPTTAEGAAAAALATGALSRIRSAVDSMVTTPNDAAQFGQFPAADLGNYVQALDQIRANVGTITFTPFHLLLNMPSAVPATGEALKAAEIGLTRKVRDHQREKGVGWERCQRLVIRLLGQPLPPIIETEWADPESRSEAVHTDALVKLRQGLGLPRSAVWAMLPASRAQIGRWETMLEEPGEAPTTPAAAGDNAGRGLTATATEE